MYKVCNLRFPFSSSSYSLSGASHAVVLLARLRVRSLCVHVETETCDERRHIQFVQGEQPAGSAGRPASRVLINFFDFFNFLQYNNAFARLKNQNRVAARRPAGPLSPRTGVCPLAVALTYVPGGRRKQRDVQLY